ncbi:MAG: hypothetical protein DCF15_13415 [Phormidesmis priestleyi]|uniref:Uncharacterized protein n=1 Tax=Phormidesmis priestleyi TaxID=268141 RepID=A0A2W4XDW1_9CYAN|nr:MAG: hypothetical protein DCF15_13415 [Phormidesmis priestleyi]
MTIYIQSRGKSQDHDYAWLKIEDNDRQEPEIPHVLKAIKPEELIDSQNPSIVLARSGEHLLLLATALDTQDGRTDFMGRQIRNSVAWVEEYSPASQQLMRKLAIQALKGKLADAVQQAVENAASNTYGFEADFKKLKEIERVANEEEIGDTKFERYPLKVGGACPDLISKLVGDLETYQLPESSGDETFVVLTTMKSAEGLKAKSVWRGLSNRIESESKEWKEYSVKKNVKAPPNRKAAQKSSIKGILILLIVGVIIMALLIFLIAPDRSQPKDQTSMQASLNFVSKANLPL